LPSGGLGGGAPGICAHALATQAAIAINKALGDICLSLII
jgi:hypothetical protein